MSDAARKQAPQLGKEATARGRTDRAVRARPPLVAKAFGRTHVRVVLAETVARAQLAIRRAAFERACKHSVERKLVLAHRVLRHVVAGLSAKGVGAAKRYLQLSRHIVWAPIAAADCHEHTQGGVASICATNKIRQYSESITNV